MPEPTSAATTTTPPYRHPGNAVVPLVIRRGLWKDGRQQVELLIGDVVLHEGWFDASLSDGEAAQELLAWWVRNRV